MSGGKPSCPLTKWYRNRVSPNPQSSKTEAADDCTPKRLHTEVTFTINGKPYTANSSVPTDTSLNYFIRTYAHLTGTKSMCHEGGCGACIVAVTSRHPVTDEENTYAVNSCLVSVFSCHGWAITTVEGIGNKQHGYNEVQTRLAHFNGTQCGYCSPGMIMNMYSLLQEKGELSMKDVENSFGGNICRCTGYRPILDAFKSFSKDATPELKAKSHDIEDLHNWKICPKNGKTCSGTCGNGTINGGLNTANGHSNGVSSITSVHVKLDGADWFKVSTISEIFEIFEEVGDVPYMLIAGNTGNGVYRRTISPKIFIDVNGIKELHGYTTDPVLTLGANMSLTEAMELFYSLSEKSKEYAYTKVLADHIDLIANVPVRNGGTIGGNLAMKNQYREFPSDMFLMLETVGATLVIADKGGATLHVSMTEFVDLDMKQRVIQSVVLKPLDASYHAKSYKIMPRAQNAHAFVNSGFLFKLDMNSNGMILEKPTVVFGGINPEFIHAKNTEEYLYGKELFNQKVLEGACKVLDSELHPDHILPDATPEYRKGLAVALFYKFILNVAPDKVKQTFASGGELLTRPLSSGQQDYETDKSVWPLNKPVTKLEALIQCSGEAEYSNDIPSFPGELFACFVLTKVGQATIKNIDASEALKIPGVVAFVSAEHIPGNNDFTPPGLLGLLEHEEIFCSGKVKHAGQPVGVLVANNQQLANKAAQKVKIEYSDVVRPIVSIRQAIASGDESRLIVHAKTEATDRSGMKEVTHHIKGSFDIGSQYHYTMETQTCVCVPTEDGIDVFPASQWMDLAQVAIAGALSMPEHNVNVKVRRVGGGYGAKISRASQVATACAIAAHHLNKPVRLVMSMETNMEALGKRMAASVDYEVGVDDIGKIKYLNANFYEDLGTTQNESVIPYTLEHMKNCYVADSWAVVGIGVKTDTPSTTFCRAPGSTEGVGTIENIMDHIARVVKKDPLEVRMTNMSTKHNSPLPQLIKEFKESTNFDQRCKEIKQFNEANRWKKKGISLVPMQYEMGLWGNFYAAVSIYAHDGSVSVCHGGIEMGQGINTKVAQVAAHILGTPLELVNIKPSNTFTAPNGAVSGGSLASEACSYATMMACKEIIERLEPVKKELGSPSWQELILAAYTKDVDLSATYMFTTKDNVKSYDIWGLASTEVEVDVLTGQQHVTRVDILEDAGNSLSPEMDIGQIEGAFVMGLGYWLTEEIVYHPETGELLTNRTWNYKPPGVKDIPIDFRIQLRRNSPNPVGVLRSKATGEPPQCMSCSAYLAVRQALNAAREDAGNHESWYKMNAPATAENIFLTSLTKFDQFAF